MPNYDMIKKRAQELLDCHFEQFCQARHWLHSHPEQSGSEIETSKWIAERLGRAGIEFQQEVGGYGVVAVVHGAPDGPVVALRGDMDALELEEKTGLPYSSVHRGLMHGCGHDFHAAGVLAVGEILAEMRDMLPGTVKLIFQPAEENGPTGGAVPMIRDGALLNPDAEAIFGAHMFPELPLGKVAVVSGPAMAAVDNFKIRVVGRGGHAAAPHETIDPIPIACEMVLAVNSAVARRLPPSESAVVSFGRISGGERRNIIPDTVELEGTVRTLTPETRQMLQQLICRIGEDVCSMNGAEAEIRWIRSYDATVNDEKMAALARRGIRGFCGRDALWQTAHPYMTAEDFGYFLQKIPGAFYWVGVREDTDMRLHSSYLRISDQALYNLIRAHLGVLFEFFREQAEWKKETGPFDDSRENGISMAAE